VLNNSWIGKLKKYMIPMKIHLRVETTKLKDKVNVLEQLVATLTSTCAPPRRPSNSDEDPPPSHPPASIH